jgi:hypothetical protein
MQTIGNTIVGALETVKDTIEKRDEAVVNRNKVFSKDSDSAASADEKNIVHQDADADEKEGVDSHRAVEPIKKFKKVTYELLDIGVFYGQQGVQTVKSLPLYQKVDSVVKFDDKFSLVMRHGEELYTMINEKISPIIQNVFFLYDKATNTITSYINVVTSKQNEINDYVNKSYSKVQV